MDFLYPLRIVLLVGYLPFPDAFWALSLAPLSQTREKVLSNFSSFETESALVLMLSEFPTWSFSNPQKMFWRKHFHKGDVLCLLSLLYPSIWNTEAEHWARTTLTERNDFPSGRISVTWHLNRDPLRPKSSQGHLNQVRPAISCSENGTDWTNRKKCFEEWYILEMGHC